MKLESVNHYYSRPFNEVISDSDLSLRQLKDVMKQMDSSIKQLNSLENYQLTNEMRLKWKRGLQ